MNAIALKKLTLTPGRHRVDDGLYLLVREGAKPSWVHRYVAVGGKRRDITLGSFETLSFRDELLDLDFRVGHSLAVGVAFWSSTPFEYFAAPQGATSSMPWLAFQSPDSRA